MEKAQCMDSTKHRFFAPCPRGLEQVLDQELRALGIALTTATAGGVSFDAPEGKVTINGENHHIAKTALIGEVHEDGLIYTVWSSPAPIEPDPYLKTYPWAAGLS